MNYWYFAETVMLMMIIGGLFSVIILYFTKNMSEPLKPLVGCMILSFFLVTLNLRYSNNTFVELLDAGFMIYAFSRVVYLLNGYKK